MTRVRRWVDISQEKGSSKRNATEVVASAFSHGAASRNRVQAAVQSKDGVNNGVGYIYMIEITARL